MAGAKKVGLLVIFLLYGMPHYSVCHLKMNFYFLLKLLPLNLFKYLCFRFWADHDLFVWMSAALLSSETTAKAKACPLYCLDVEYMTCKSSGDEKLNPVCNCCLAPKDCTLHLTDGSSIYCNKSWMDRSW